jgi:RNA polymerase sigma factor (sigma-70 family)
MTPLPLSADVDDSLLVERSLAGDRHAFGCIVGRYQTLVCALAYSATGSRCHSEDLAQETFVTAWRSLRELREPARLRAWLCGIARNVIHGDLRRLGRQPTHEADRLDHVAEVVSTEPQPAAQAVSNEELAILWREVGRLPEIYREPLILFYREHQSVERVAAALELTPDATLQRLSRGRRLLQERMLAFVETTLARTNPGPAFTAQVQSALPFVAGVGSAAAGAAPATAAAKGGVLGAVLAWALPLVGVFAAIGVSWSDIAQARTPRERRFLGRWNLALWLSVGAFVAAVPIVARWANAAGWTRRGDWHVTAPMVGTWFAFTFVAATLITLMLRGRAALRREMAAVAPASVAPIKPASLLARLAVVAGVVTALFWILIFIAWQTGDRLVAGSLLGGVVALIVMAPLLGWCWPSADESTLGGWYVSGCALVFLGILNWRLDVWLAVVYRVDLSTMHHLLPMGLVHGLSLFLVAWVGTLLWFTRVAKP